MFVLCQDRKISVRSKYYIDKLWNEHCSLYQKHAPHNASHLNSNLVANADSTNDNLLIEPNGSTNCSTTEQQPIVTFGATNYNESWPGISGSQLK